MMVDGKTGFLVEKDNPEHLIEKLTLLLEDKKLGQKMGDDGHKFVEETFNLEVVAKNFVKIAKSYFK